MTSFGRPPRIKRLAQDEVQILDGQRQPAKGVRGRFVQTGLLEAPGDASKPGGERGRLVVLAEVAQPASHLLRPLPRGSNGPERRLAIHATGLDALEHGAFELPAIPGPLAINATATTLERRTRLLPASRLPVAFRRLQRQAQRAQPRRVVPRLEFDVGENDPIAAKAALEAKGVRIARGPQNFR